METRPLDSALTASATNSGIALAWPPCSHAIPRTPSISNAAHRRTTPQCSPLRRSCVWRSKKLGESMFYCLKNSGKSNYPENFMQDELQQIGFRYETHPSCDDDDCTQSEHLYHQKSIMKSQRNALLIAATLVFYWMLYIVTHLVVRIEQLNQRVERLKNKIDNWECASII